MISASNNTPWMVELLVSCLHVLGVSNRMTTLCVCYREAGVSIVLLLRWISHSAREYLTVSRTSVYLCRNLQPNRYSTKKFLTS